MRLEREEFRNLAEDTLGDRELAEKWLNAPSPLFGGFSPLAACASEEGRNRASLQLLWMAGSQKEAFLQGMEESCWSDPFMRLLFRRAQVHDRTPVAFGRKASVAWSPSVKA